MKPEMTSRERMLAAIRRQEVDHVPLGQVFHSTVRDTPPEKRWHNQFERAKVMQELGIDPSVDIWMPIPTAPPEIPVRTWRENDPEGPQALLCAEYETPAGTLVQKVRQTPDWRGPTHYRFVNDWDGAIHRTAREFDRIDMVDDWFTRRYKVPLVRGEEDLDKLAYLLRAPCGEARDMWINNALAAKQIAADMNLLTHARRVSVGDWFMWICLIEDFLCALFENPDYVSRLFDLVQEYNREILKLVLEVQPDLVQYRGWYDTPDYWGRERYATLLKPKIDELAHMTHEGGCLFCILLPEGYTAYRDIHQQIAVDVMLGLEPLAARKSEDFSAIKAALKGHCCIWGGVNAPVTLGTGSDAEIAKAVRDAIDTLGRRGFILNAAMYIYDDDVSWDRFMVFIDAWRKYC